MRQKIGNSLIVPSFYPVLQRRRFAIYGTRLRLEFDEMGAHAIELNYLPKFKGDVGKTWQVLCLRELRKYFFYFYYSQNKHRPPYEFSQELELAGVSAIHGINTIPFEMVYPNDFAVSQSWRRRGFRKPTLASL